MKMNRKQFLLLIVILYFPIAINAQEKNLNSDTIATDYTISNSIDYGNKYLNGWDDLTPIITTYVNKDGTVSVCSVDMNSAQTYMYEYTKDLQLTGTFVFKNEMEKFGAFTKDNEGNYYLFFAKYTANGNESNMIMVKYNPEGEKEKTYMLKAYASGSFNGISNPFYAGSCRLELSGSMLAVYFARKMFDGHQASYGFVLDKDTFERIDRGTATNSNRTGWNTEMPYCSHSFNQFILPIDNGFVFANQGDAYPRGFGFSIFQKGSATRNLNAYGFKKGRTYQYTFAQMGGLAKTTNGYIFLGAGEKNLLVSHFSHNDSRNLFVITIDDAFNSFSKPIWITNYTNRAADNAANPKIAFLGSDRYLLMWECMTENNYKSTFMMIINEKGESLGSKEELPGIRLNINDVLRYNPHNGKVYWAINDSSKSITVYSLGVDRDTGGGTVME
jgi:hypothetical protein